jgi:glycine amidinotransferase
MKTQTEQKSPLETSCHESTCPVSVYTEWDPLEEVIVGSITDARIPDWHPSVSAILPPGVRSFFKDNAGQLFPSELVCRAQFQLDNFASFLSSQGITVRRPENIKSTYALNTPFFSATGSLYHAMPRDGLFTAGHTIIEAPMCWRNRYFETFGFRKILKEYFDKGAYWVAGPKPMLSDDLYTIDREGTTELQHYALTELEPVFDAADFIRVGYDIIGQVSCVTNWAGVNWLRRILGSQFRVRVYAFEEPAPMHIDTTILPLAPGKLLINPSWVSRVPDAFQDWEILRAPEPNTEIQENLYLSSKWISMNVLMLDEKHVVVEEREENLIGALKGWGFEPIPMPFRAVQAFGGSFHCATLDIRRSGKPRNYLC